MIVKKDPSFIKSYLEDSAHLKEGFADEVAIPESIDEISPFLKEADSRHVPVTVSGAGTGQAGGRVPLGGAVLSTEKLNSIKKIYTLEGRGRVTLESGVVIKDLKSACAEKGLFYTYDPTEQTAFVGGTIATNAAGARSFRYGPTRKSVKALKIVLARGDIFYLRRGDFRAKGRRMEFDLNGTHFRIEVPSYHMPPTKSQAGYYAGDNMDLVDLFVGSEGTLGVIAEAELEVALKPKGFLSFFAFFAKEPAAWDFAGDARACRPLAIEYFDKKCLDILAKKYGSVPSGKRAAIYVEDEISVTEDDVLEKWESLLGEHGIPLDDTWVAMNEKSRLDFIDRRHYVPEYMDEMAKRSGFPKVSTDLAVPVLRLEEMLVFYGELLEKSGMDYSVFGHIGDAHLHVNMLPSRRKDREKAEFLRYEFVKKSVSLGGTVSAEHGIGKAKRDFLKILYGEKGIAQMRKVKEALDPNFILGRGNIFEI